MQLVCTAATARGAKTTCASTTSKTHNGPNDPIRALDRRARLLQERHHAQGDQDVGASAQAVHQDDIFLGVVVSSVIVIPLQ